MRIALVLATVLAYPRPRAAHDVAATSSPWPPPGWTGPLMVAAVIGAAVVTTAAIAAFIWHRKQTEKNFALVEQN